MAKTRVLVNGVLSAAMGMFYGALVLAFAAWWTLLPTLGLFWVLGVLR